MEIQWFELNRWFVSGLSWTDSNPFPVRPNFSPLMYPPSDYVRGLFKPLLFFFALFWTLETFYAARAQELIPMSCLPLLFLVTSCDMMSTHCAFCQPCPQQPRECHVCIYTRRCGWMKSSTGFCCGKPQPRALCKIGKWPPCSHQPSFGIFKNSPHLLLI